ncbi:hypothetical protein TanjilG_02315 [Lupinus angustifolius]|uniref:DUF7806 domain-containing protein n=1 Tax=Lupinus angustifolius TaxID=3871 RepID=A0A4P1QQU0_LUPAN|nr:hypothetical protein TanjilG_02315 [Lupinus angustifolius]
MQQEGTSGDLNDNSKVIAEDDLFGAISNSPSRGMTRKHSKRDELENEARFKSCGNSDGNSVARESAQSFCKETASGKLLECSTKTNDQSVTVGLFKLFSDHQTQQLCLSALHLSSGTFERVASEWMREDIMFSPYMCPVFFERVSRVIKLNH